MAEPKTARGVAASNRAKPRGRPRATRLALTQAHAAARTRICEAALALFDRGGIEGISMREVAKEMGVSPMMPYKYFPSKDHLLQEMRTLAFRQLEAALRVASGGEGDAGARLEAVILAYLRFGRDEPRAYRLMFDYWVYDSPGVLLEAFGEDARRQSGAWQVLLTAVQACFESNDAGQSAPAAAHMTWAAMHGLVSLEASRKLVLGLDYQDLIAPMVRTIMGGLLLPGSLARPARTRAPSRER